MTTQRKTTMTTCPECNDTGERDSGGTPPWGEPVYLPCDCKDAEIGKRWREDSSLEKWFPLTAERLAALEAENAALKREAYTWWQLAASAEVQKKLAAAWNDGFSFARKGSGWQSGEDPSTEGLYVARDSKGNVEVGMWYAKTFSGQAAEWSKEFRDLDRDDIVAWMMVPPN